LKSGLAGPSRAEHAETPGNAGGDGSHSAPLENAPPLPDPLSALSTAPPGTVAPHRLDLARALAGGVIAALAEGDTAGARVALDALRELVDAAERSASAATTSDGAPVVDLARERERRGR
jgi:hypothetical protein